MTSYLITGASGGLGLAIVTQLAGAPSTEVSHVFATARKRTPELGDLVNRYSDRVDFIHLDVTDNASCVKAAEEVERFIGNRGLDILINNAAINPRDGVERMSV
jgi:NAD(P)-dependent dehydrogenase (short-subunit alcohol dehydrogenase family)